MVKSNNFCSYFNGENLFFILHLHISNKKSNHGIKFSSNNANKTIKTVILPYSMRWFIHSQWLNELRWLAESNCLLVMRFSPSSTTQSLFYFIHNWEGEHSTVTNVTHKSPSGLRTFPSSFSCFVSSSSSGPTCDPIHQLLLKDCHRTGMSESRGWWDL